MRVGSLRHRLTFQRRQTGTDDFGQPLAGWEDIATVWASIEPISGRELLAAQQTQGEITHRIRCRYRDGLSTASRALFKERVFDLQSVINPRELNASLEILANEGLTDG
ncbi:phage head-tail adaptor, putative, SPP1 family [Azotobacter beijerinckii]|uniref:Phage head-tail adaptor, putative, SPP1 family n=1 Tax=Azotobacter beijerinckii TaxID=170623 RepID=A0A1H6XRH9_9GAMM|nr:phage head closure protein [Azotobacter beijerinckii]SEJ31649.1 phage head-tail adaptor, putative, SPP1 family [Azotobacter beijerinckii]